jgi:hypothetical protein
MKVFKPFLIVLVVLSAFICVYPRLQTPTPVKLNADASKAWVEIDNQQREVVRRANEALQQLEAQKHALLLGAGVPRAELNRECTPDASGIVTCVPPKQESAKSPSPTPKAN